DAGLGRIRSGNGIVTRTSCAPHSGIVERMGDHEQERGRVSREEWTKRVERWRESGLTCAEFAAELGINPRTLTYWKWMFAKEARGEKRAWPKREARSS